MRRINTLLLGSMLLLLPLGCSDDDTTGPDASDSVDSSTGIDGAVADSGPGPDANILPGACGVELKDGVPGPSYQGIRVLFSNPDGTVLGRAVTDVDGKASITTCVAGTMITLAAPLITANGGPFSSPNELYTVAGVNPGDTLRLGYGNAASGPSTLHVMDPSGDLTAFGDSPPSTYQVLAADGYQGPFSSSTALGVDYNYNVPYPATLPGNTFDVLARTDSPRGYAFKKNVPVVADSTVTLPTWALPGTFSYSYLNLPPGTGGYWTLTWLADLNRGITEHSGGMGEGVVSAYGERDLPVGFPNKIFNHYETCSYGGSFTSQSGAQWLSGDTTSNQVDLAGSALPEIDEMIVSLADPTRPELVFGTVGGTLSDYDGVFFNVYWSEAVTVPVAAAGPVSVSVPHTWRVAFAPTASSGFKFPALPDDLASFAPTSKSLYEGTSEPWGLEADWSDLGGLMTETMSPWDIFSAPYIGWSIARFPGLYRPQDTGWLRTWLGTCVP